MESPQCGTDFYKERTTSAPDELSPLREFNAKAAKATKEKGILGLSESSQPVVLTT